MELRIPVLEKLIELFAEWLRRDRRKALTQRDVVLASFAKDDLVVDICAEIVLGETGVPDVEFFLRRIRLGRPYCLRCSRPLEAWRASWMANYGQIGYQCCSCGTQIEGDRAALVDDIRGQVRRDFYGYWGRYEEEIRHLTDGKPYRYKLGD